MRQENLKDAAQILATILHHPLDIEGASEAQVSLLGAVLRYNPKAAETSDLSKILQSFTKYPEPTETLIQELELLSKDLSA